MVGHTNVLDKNIMRQFCGLPNATFAQAIGIDYHFTTVNLQTQSSTAMQYIVWTQKGQERHRSLSAAHYKGTSCMLCVYDVSNRQSFEQIKRFFANLIYNPADNADNDYLPPFVICAINYNSKYKSDDGNDGDREDVVTAKEEKQLHENAILRVKEFNMSIAKRNGDWNARAPPTVLQKVKAAMTETVATVKAAMTETVETQNDQLSDPTLNGGVEWRESVLRRSVAPSSSNETKESAAAPATTTATAHAFPKQDNMSKCYNQRHVCTATNDPMSESKHKLPLCFLDDEHDPFRSENGAFAVQYIQLTDGKYF